MDLTVFLKKTVDTINNLIKSLSSAETTTDINTNTTDTTTTPAANENSSSEQGTSTGNNLEDNSDGEDGSKKGKDDGRSDTQQLEKLRNNLNQISESLIQLQKFEESDLAKQLQIHLHNLEAKFGTVRNKNEQTLSPTPNAPSSSPKVPLSDYLTFINKELMKMKYQIPSIRKLSMTSSKAHSRASSGSNEGSSVQELPKLHNSESFPKSSFYIEIEGIFDGLKKDEEKFILSCFAVLTEGAVVKRRLLTYWGIGEGCLKDSKSETPEEIVDRILLKFKEMGLIEPAMNKRKQEVRSYKMDPLVRSALNKIFQEKNMFDYDPNGNVEENSAPNNKAFLVKDEGKASDDKSRSQQGDQPNLDPEKLFTLFNVNEHSPDAKLIHLVRKKSKDMNVVDWLSKMKSLKVLYLGRWQKSASYHIESYKTSCLATLFFLTLAICKTFISISPTMSSSDYKQTNPGETLPFTKIVQTIDNLIEHHPILKSKPSLEHRPIFESKPSLETTTATTSGNGSPKVEIKSEGKGSSEGGKEDSKIDSQLLEKIQNNLNQIKDSFIQLKRFGESELAKQLKTCLSDLDPRLHGHAIFGVVSVSDTRTGTTRRIPVSGECPLFFFVSPTRADAARHDSDAVPTCPTCQQ
ncbi:hypothetical protein CFP56_036340 [Quercus suber]|uniref:DUF4806 domain-containing protein n=1 Tax=Quercus suber TaxID=58331 RepID=A0AAW0J8J0_QUESU